MNNEAKILADYIVLDAMISGRTLNKTASITDTLKGLSSEFVDFFHSQIDMSNPLPSVLNLIAPILLMKLPGKLSWLGWILMFVQTVFDVNLTGMIDSIIEKIKSLFSSKEKPTESDVKAVVDSEVHSTFDAAQGDPQKAEEALAKKSSIINKRIKNALLLKSYAELNLPITKSAGITDSALAFVKGQSKGFFAGTLSWLFNLGLWAAGLLGGKFLFNKVMGRKTKTPGSKPDSDSTSKPTELSKLEETHSKISYSPVIIDLPKSKSAYSYETTNRDPIWLEERSGTIENTMVEWATDLYPDLISHEQELKNSTQFKNVLTALTDASSNSTSFIKIPRDINARKLEDIINFYVEPVARTLHK